MSLTRTLVVSLAMAAMSGVASGLALAQVPAAPSGNLLVTVVDQSGAVIPNATVTVTSQERPAGGATPPVGATPTAAVGVLLGK